MKCSGSIAQTVIRKNKKSKMGMRLRIKRERAPILVVALGTRFAALCTGSFFLQPAPGVIEREK